MKKNVLIWAGWYPKNSDDYNGLFIKKHIEIISQIGNIHVFTIHHEKRRCWFRRQVIQEHFGKVYYWKIPNFFLLKLIGYNIIPFIEAYYAKQRFNKIDIFHLHVSYPYAVFTFLLHLVGIQKWVLTEHWSRYTFYDNSLEKKNIIFLYLLKNRLKVFDKVSVVSLFLKNDLLRRFRFLTNKTIITDNVLSKNHQLRINQSIHNSIKLLTISNLKDSHKNISFLLKVISEIIKIYPNITLDIYGEGSDKKMLLQIAKDLNLFNTHVFFKGKVDNKAIPDVYVQYHAFILLSKFESFSIVTAEAILHGLPVIVSKCGGPEEYVIRGVNGYLVEINNLEQTIHAIQELISNYSNFKPELVKNTLIEKYSVEKVYKQFIELYDIEKSF